MELRVVRSGSELALAGSVDLVSRQLLIDAGTDVLHDEGALTLNLKAVEFMDSVGIGALVHLAREADSLAAPFAVVEPSPPVQRVLDVTGLTEAWVPGRPITGPV